MAIIVVRTAPTPPATAEEAAPTEEAAPAEAGEEVEEGEESLTCFEIYFGKGDDEEMWCEFRVSRDKTTGDGERWRYYEDDDEEEWPEDFDKELIIEILEPYVEGDETDQEEGKDITKEA